MGMVECLLWSHSQYLHIQEMKIFQAQDSTTVNKISGVISLVKALFLNLDSFTGYRIYIHIDMPLLSTES